MTDHNDNAYGNRTLNLVEFRNLVDRHHQALRDGETYRGKLQLSHCKITGERTDKRVTFSMLRGVHMSYCELSGIELSCSDLCYGVLRDCVFVDCNLSGCDLSYVKFINSSFKDVCFYDTNLAHTSLSGVTFDNCLGLPDAPFIPNIDRQILDSIRKTGGKLDMGNWHRCETTHCRAGWAIHLAGDAGKQLERSLGPDAAGALIYNKSRPGTKVPDWYGYTEEALADLEACAEKYI